MNALKFDLPKDKSSIIKVLGVGGGGGNAVNHMFNQGIKGVDFVICNTDLQALEASSIPNKIQLGVDLTAGLGAGADPEKGHHSAMEAIEDIIEVLGVDTKMLFVTAGMGGGTGTGAAPVIAKAARDLDILTVGIVTTPFSFEGKKRKLHAEEGIEQLKRSVDCLLVINNDKIKDMYGNLPIRTAFSHANDILTIAAKGIAEIITHPGYINVDFEDVKTVMRNSGVALMGSASAEGENRAIEAARTALASPLLNDNQIFGAKNILLNISFGSSEVLMDEIDAITSFIQEEAGQNADVIFGTSIDETLGDKLAVTVICTGFESKENRIIFTQKPEVKTTHNLYEPVNKINQQINVTAPQPDVKAVEINNITEEEINEPVLEVETPIVHTLILDETTAPQNPIQAEEKTAEVEAEIVNPYEPFLKITTPEEIENIVIDEPVNNFTDEIENEPVFELDEVIENNQDELAQLPEVSEIEFEFEDNSNTSEQEERIKKSIDRLKKIKELNLQINSPVGLRDLEKEPAYIRRQKKLNDVPHSSENSSSRLSLFDDGTNNGIRTNNSFLHDNVD